MTNHNEAVGALLVGSGLVAASALAWRSRRTSALAADPRRDDTWVHPVPNLDDRSAVVSNEFRTGVVEHLGVDLMYRRRDSRDLLAAFPPGTSGGTPMFFMPDNVSALAASDGVVTLADATPVGNTVIIRHANGWATYYTHLASLAVTRGAPVVAGQVLGTIGASPRDAAHLRHLHFEMWRDGKRTSAVDPAPFLAAWRRTSASPLVALRNGSFSSYRPVGERGDAYPEWVRNLRGESGVYVIREIDGPIVYVGSSVRRLYETLTRHFQAWRRYKGFWRGQFAEGADPGLTYPRSSVEVAIKLTRPDDAHDEELRTIQRLRPRDNQLGQLERELEAAPF